MLRSQATSHTISTSPIMTVICENKTIDIHDDMIVQMLIKLTDESTSKPIHTEDHQPTPQVA